MVKTRCASVSSQPPMTSDGPTRRGFIAALVSSGLVAVLHSRSSAQSRSTTVVPSAVTRSIQLRDLDDRPVDPLLDAAGGPVVVIFTSVECPISNRYAPELRRLHEAFSTRGVRFHLVYPNPADAPPAIRTHHREFAYPMSALRDPRGELVALTGATVTPEAAVFHKRTLVYRGRIDDRFVAFGVERPAATERDLENALNAILAGRPVVRATTPAIGCFLSDFLR